MPKRKVLISVTVARGSVVTKNSRGGEVHRPAERIDLKPGQIFDFTEDEIADIMAGDPGALAESVEVALTDSTVTAGEVVAKTAAKGKRAKGAEDL